MKGVVTGELDFEGECQEVFIVNCGLAKSSPLCDVEGEVAQTLSGELPIFLTSMKDWGINEIQQQGLCHRNTQFLLVLTPSDCALSFRPLSIEPLTEKR